jgi:hypothetical protein
VEFEYRFIRRKEDSFSETASLPALTFNSLISDPEPENV